MERKKNETTDAYLKRLFEMGDQAVSNLNKVKADMAKAGVVGFCKECGGDLFKDVKHKHL
jgi:hypothetical protein